MHDCETHLARLRRDPHRNRGKGSHALIPLTCAHARKLDASGYDFNDALLPIGTEFWVSLVDGRPPLQKDRI